MSARVCAKDVARAWADPMTVKKVLDPAMVACSLQQRQLVERRQRWQALAARAALDIAANERGLRLIFHAERGVEEELSELAALERECCSFADWSVRPTDGEIVLEISGASGESIAAVHGMFADFARPKRSP